jgi:hypothetical protein
MHWIWHLLGKSAANRTALFENYSSTNVREAMDALFGALFRSVAFTFWARYHTFMSFLVIACINALTFLLEHCDVV